MRGSKPCRVILFFRCLVILLSLFLQVVHIQKIVHLENGCDVSASVAVVGSRPYCDNVFVVHHFEPFLYKLVRPGNQLETVQVIELFCNLPSKEPAGATRADTPRLNVLRIGPHQVAEWPLVRHFLHTHDRPNLVERT